MHKTKDRKSINLPALRWVQLIQLVQVVLGIPDEIKNKQKSKQRNFQQMYIYEIKKDSKSFSNTPPLKKGGKITQSVSLVV